MLKLLTLLMLLCAPLAQGKEPVPEQPAAAPLIHGKNAEQRLKAPLGARISDVLARQDREAAVEILEHENVSLSEKMNLLFLAGRKGEAADIAFILMERSGMDEALYEQSAPILLENGRTFGVMSTFRSFDSYRSINNRAGSSGHRLGGFKFDLGIYQEKRSNADAALLNSVPDETGADIALHRGGDSYDNVFGLQFSRAFNDQTGMSFKHQHQVGSRLGVEALLAHNQAATENAAMRIIGRSSLVALQGAYSLDRSSQWTVKGSHHQYQSVDGEALGSGKLLTTTLNHQVSDVHPALHTRITGTWSRFQPAGNTLTGHAANLIPAGQGNTTDYFMPQDVSEIAFYATIGDATDSRLPAHDLEFFGEIGVFDNTAGGTSGWRASAGLAGRVISADRLQMFIQYDQAPSGQDFSSLEAGVAYLLHY